MFHLPTPEQLKEERQKGEERRRRIALENELMREKIAMVNKQAQERIRKDFIRRCKAVEARQAELKERGLRLTEHSPFHVDLYKQVHGVA